MIGVVFPGQGSQRPGMGQSLCEETTEGARVFDLVSQATGIDLKELCFSTSEEELRKTENAQIALFTCSLAAWFALKSVSNADVKAFAGHSVGEYAAIVAAGALSIEEGAILVRKRGEIMAKAGRQKPGTMAAVLGLERDQLQEVCNEVSSQGVCVIANDNSPGQLVISGDTDAVHAASALAGERGAKRVIPLSVSGAFHSPLMEIPAQEMGEALAQVPFNTHKQEKTVYANVTASPVSESSQWPKLLEEQLRAPVQWTESIQKMAADGFDTLIECGVGEVLCGLVRRINKEVKTLKVVDLATLEDVTSQMG